MLAFSLLLVAKHLGPDFELVVCRDEVASLSQRLNREVTVGRDLGRHLLYVRHDPSNPSNELSAVATALKAVVEGESSSLSVRRMPKEIALLRKSWAAARADCIQRRLDRDVQFWKAQNADQTPAAAVQKGIQLDIQAETRYGAGNANAWSQPALVELTPAHKLLLTLARSIGVSSLAALPVGKTVLYETTPVGDAQPLPDATDALRDFNAAQSSLSDFKIELEQRQVLPPETNFSLVGIGGGFRPAVALRIRVNAGPSGLVAQLEAFDAEGKLVASSIFWPTPFEGTVGTPGWITKYARGPNVQTVPVPRELSQRFAMATKDQAPVWLEQPVEMEPMSLYASLAMRTLASEDSTPCVVIDMDDDLFANARDAIKDDQLNVTAFRAILGQWNAYERLDKRTFVVWRPTDPEDRVPADRKQLEALARSSLGSKLIDARQLAVCEQGHSALWAVWLSGLETQMPWIRQDQELRVPDSATRQVIGAISDADWNLLLAGKTLTSGQMGVTDKVTQYFNEPVQPVNAQQLPDLLRHPAELYGDASFDATPFSIAGKPKAVYRIIDSTKRTTQWDPQGAGMKQFSIGATLVDGKPVMNESRDQFEGECEQRFTFQTGVRMGTSLVIGLPRHLAITSNLPSPVQDVSDPMHYSELPPALRDRTWNNIVQVAVNKLAAKRN